MSFEQVATIVFDRGTTDDPGHIAVGAYGASIAASESEIDRKSSVVGVGCAIQGLGLLRSRYQHH